MDNNTKEHSVSTVKDLMIKVKMGSGEYRKIIASRRDEIVPVLAHLQRNATLHCVAGALSPWENPTPTPLNAKFLRLVDKKYCSNPLNTIFLCRVD